MATVAVVAYGVLGVVYLIVTLHVAGQFHLVFERARAQIANGRLGTGATPTFDVGLWYLPYVFQSLQLLAGVGFLVWQQRAASTAVRLGYPARHSPGLGVGSWFIPIVSLWFPYQALVDCLPPTDPARRRGLPAWLCYLGSTLLGGAALAVRAFGGSGGVALALVVVAVLLLVVAVTSGIGLVTRIGQAHREDAARRGW